MTAASSSVWSSLPVTDGDVLAQLAKDDEIATDVDAAFHSLGAAVPAAMLDAWQTDLTAYRADAAKWKAAASGGFIFGAWEGVPDMYWGAVNWGQRLKTHAADAKTIGAQVPTLPDTPAPLTPGQVPGGLGNPFQVDLTTKLTIGIAALAAIYVARKVL